MTVGAAKSIARAWVAENAPEVPGLWAVMFGGSMSWQPDGAELSPHSDVDVWHLIKGDIDPKLRQRKILHQGVILELSYHGRDGCRDVETALEDWVLSPHLAAPSVIWDPSGELSVIQREVARRYNEPALVRQRCQRIASDLLDDLVPNMTTWATLDDRATAFGFAVSTMQQIPIVASLKPPTVRKAGVYFTDIMRACGQEQLSEERLRFVGSAGLDRAAVEDLLLEATRAYDRAVEVWHTPLWFDFDLCHAARPIMIGGSREMIDRGYPREAAWWIWVTHFFARTALLNDAPQEYECTFRAPYERIAALLGVDSFGALEGKALLARELVPRLMKVADDIIAGQHGGSL